MSYNPQLEPTPTSHKSTRTPDWNPSASDSLGESRKKSRILKKAIISQFYQTCAPIELANVAKNIEDLSELGDNWNGSSISSPKPKSLEYALSWVQFAYASVLESGSVWLSPHITADEEGDVVFEWWNGPKKLIIYVSPTDISFVRVWGANITDEMAEGMIQTKDEFLQIWIWVIADK